MTHARAPWLLLIVTVLLFAPLSMADFLWDDQILVTENLLTGDWHNLPEFFRIGLWESTPIAETDSAYYRPMMLVDLWLDRQLFGLSPLAHHLHSLAWHLLCTWLLWRLLLLLAPGNRRAAVAAGIFALHPLSTETVAFIAARNDAMAVAGILGALLLLAPRDCSRRRLVLAGAVTLYGLLAKETAILILPMLLCLDWLRFGGLGPKDRYLPPVVAIAITIGLRSLSSVDSLEIDVGAALAQAPTVLGYYASLLVWPLGTSPTVPIELLPAHGLALAAALLIWTVLLVLGRKTALVGLLLAVLGLLPALAGVLQYGGLPYRYAYLSLVGVAVAVHACLNSRALPLGLGVAALLAIATSSGLRTWSSTLDLWEAGYAYAPGGHTACGLFKALEAEATNSDTPERRDAFEEAAEDMLERSLQPPPSTYCCYSASRWYWLRGRPDLAQASAERALANGCPGSAELLAPYAISLAVLGQWEEAEGWAEMVDRDPTGLVPLVLSAAALRRGDSSVLEAWEARDGGDGAMPIREQVEMILGTSASSSPSSSESPTPEPPPQ